MALAVPLTLSVSFLGQFVGSWFKRRETAVLFFIAISLPLFFQIGVAWPIEAIPNAIRIASLVSPSTAAIDGLVRINQMGASLPDVRRNWQSLWTLATVYAVLAVASAWWSRGGQDEQQNSRAVSLVAKGSGCRQLLDDTTTQLGKAQADVDLKHAQLTAASAGPTKEELALADAKVVAAQAAVAEARSAFDKTMLKAPVDATVLIKIAERGEALSPGAPVMTLELKATGKSPFAQAVCRTYP
ncbi:ABC transporter permease [Rhizobium sp. LjRoot258]|uniref:ABC transporter permease n=1 Tax=Rhizobium sp. LjRoot258 TaxID=3342299 RepID=UPI003ECDD39B